MKLFEQYPYLENDSIVISRLTEADIPGLEALTTDSRVGETIPTFLYEYKYEDKHEMLAHLDAECFETKESVLMGIRKKASGQFCGVAEIYGYDEDRQKASIGCRLLPTIWGEGVATQGAVLLRDHLLLDIGLRTITAHVLRGNEGSARVLEKSGFINKYPGVWEDWGFGVLQLTDKYVFKREWLGKNAAADRLPPVDVEQFVMAYGIEQDRVRAMLPVEYQSLRPVLRINAEIRDGKTVYVEFNTPVECGSRRGWLNIANWKSTHDPLSFIREGKTVTITAPFLTLTYTGTGATGGCPAEKDNEGCFYISHDLEFRPAEVITENKEFCDCSFSWHFHAGDACGVSEGKTIPAYNTEREREYERCALTAENAASIPCRQVLGAYIVRFKRYDQI